LTTPDVEQRVRGAPFLSQSFCFGDLICRHVAAHALTLVECAI